MNTNNQINATDHNEIGMIAACIADAVLPQLYEFLNTHHINGYIGTLDTISQWAKEFYDQYDETMTIWEEFEESEANIFNAVSWDDFVIEWSLARLQRFLKEHNQTPANPVISSDSKTPKAIIEIRGGMLAALYSSQPLRYACIDYDNTERDSPSVGIYESDTVSGQLYTLYGEDNELVNRIRYVLRENKF